MFRSGDFHQWDVFIATKSIYIIIYHYIYIVFNNLLSIYIKDYHGYFNRNGFDLKIVSG